MTMPLTMRRDVRRRATAPIVGAAVAAVLWMAPVLAAQNSPPPAPPLTPSAVAPPPVAPAAAAPGVGRDSVGRGGTGLSLADAVRQVVRFSKEVQV